MKRSKIFMVLLMFVLLFTLFGLFNLKEKVESSKIIKYNFITIKKSEGY